MLSTNALELLLDRHNLSGQSRSIINRVRAEQPAERVRSGFGRKRTGYQSHKMGQTLQAGDDAQFALLYVWEYSDDILEIWDRPPAINIRRQTKSGRPTAYLHTPHYFTLSHDFIGWADVYSEEKLLKLAEQAPDAYIRDEQGNWRSPPAEEYAAQFGLSYKLYSSAQISSALLRNVHYLRDYRRDDCPPIEDKTVTAIFEVVKSEPGICLDELFECLEDIQKDDVFTLIAQERIYVDLQTDPLPEHDRVRCFPDAITARAYQIVHDEASEGTCALPLSVRIEPDSEISWDARPWRIVNIGETTTTLIPLDITQNPVELPNDTFEALVRRGTITGLREQERTGLAAEAWEIFNLASTEDRARALHHKRIIEPYVKGGIPTEEQQKAYKEIRERTRNDWKNRYRRAQRLYGSGLIGLLPQRWKQGNRKLKLCLETHEAIDKFADEHYQPHKPAKKLLHLQLKEYCRQQGIDVPGYKTFARAVRLKRTYENEKHREGPRGAYDLKPSGDFFWFLGPDVPRHGDRPFHIGHIDHTELDIELRCSQTGKSLGRIWATFLTDAFSRRILAIYLSFDPPSYRSCMMAVRICVMRHGRLPDILVMDGGAEFKSAYFESLLAMLECTLRPRPTSDPRAGATLERLFGTTNTQFIYKLYGNTQATKNPRKMTKHVDPKRLAVWPLNRLYSRICEYGYDIYDQSEHSVLGMTPRQAFTRGIADHGLRQHRLIPYDENFILATLPTTDSGTAMVQRNRGVKINQIYYKHTVFLDPEVERTNVPVRYDPFDVGTAYAQVKGTWVKCWSGYRKTFQGRTERQIQIATEEIRRRHQLHNQHVSISEQRLANFLDSVDTEQKMLLQQLRDEEARRAYTDMGIHYTVQPGDTGMNLTDGEQESMEWWKQQLDYDNDEDDGGTYGSYN